MSGEGRELLQKLYRGVFGKLPEPDEGDTFAFRRLADHIRHHDLGGVSVQEFYDLLLVAREEVDLDLLPFDMKAWVLEQLTMHPLHTEPQAAYL